MSPARVHSDGFRHKVHAIAAVFIASKHNLLSCVRFKFHASFVSIVRHLSLLHLSGGEVPRQATRFYCLSACLNISVFYFVLNTTHIWYLKIVKWDNDYMKRDFGCKESPETGH